MTPSVTIRLAIATQPTLRNRSTLDTVNGTAARLSSPNVHFQGKMYPETACQFFSISVWGKSSYNQNIIILE
jgi:hypothetical protein